MRRFLLRRDEDVSATSGVGYVAEGLEFWDGTCAMHWRTTINSTTVYKGIDDLLAIHSHEGRSTIEWIDSNHTHPPELIVGENMNKKQFSKEINNAKFKDVPTASKTLVFGLIGGAVGMYMWTKRKAKAIVND